MPQEFYVLRCFSCDTFQVHIVKKAKKWDCKMCGARQSLKRNYGKGSSKDCRAQVMKLNEIRMLKSEIPDEFENETLDENFEEVHTPQTKQSGIENKPSVSKWSEYLDVKPDEETDSDDDKDNFSSMLFENNERESKKRVRNNAQKCKDFTNKKMKIKEAENPEKMPHTINEEQSHSFEALNPVHNFKFNKPNQKTNDNHSFIQSKSTAKQSKYSKYLDEDESESNDDLLGNVKKSSNIFDADPADLDSILNF